MLHSCLWLWSSHRQLWELFFNMEKHGLRWAAGTSLTQPHAEHAFAVSAGWLAHSQNLLWGIMGPCKLLRRPKALVSQGHCCVDDILAITTHHHKPRNYRSQGGKYRGPTTYKRNNDSYLWYSISDHKCYFSWLLQSNLISFKVTYFFEYRARCKYSTQKSKGKLWRWGYCWQCYCVAFSYKQRWLGTGRWDGLGLCGGGFP